MLPHKEIVLPEVDLSRDEGDPRWHAAGGMDSTPVYREDGSVAHYRHNGLPPGHYAEYWRLCIAEAWTENAGRFESDPDDVYAAWWYVDSHPVFWQFNQQHIHEDYPVNHVCHLEMEGALHRGWPEIIPFRDENGTGWGYEFGERSLFQEEASPGAGLQFVTYHDWKLDGWEKTYELAVIAIAKKIWDSYGNDRRVVDSEEWRKGGG